MGALPILRSFMNHRLKAFFGISLAGVSLIESMAHGMDVKGLETNVVELTDLQGAEQVHRLKEQILAELTKIQDELNELRAEALRMGDVETLQEITFVIRYAEKVKDYEDIQMMNAEKEKFIKFKEHISEYLKNFANK